MAEESISLKPFLLGDPPNKALSECAAAAAAALKTGLVDLGALDWRDLATEITQKLEEMFDIRLTDVLASAWKDYEALNDCADPAKHPADETISLPMVQHRIETSCGPASTSPSALSRRSALHSRSPVGSSSKASSSRSKMPPFWQSGSARAAPKEASNARGSR